MITLSPEQINSAFANLSDEVVFASNIIDPGLKIKEISVQNNLEKETSASLDFLLTLKIVNLINEKTLLEEIYALPIEGIGLKNKIFEQIKAIYKSVESLVESKKEQVLLLQHKDTEQVEDERFSNLPARVKDSIAFSGWEESLFEITKNHKLNIDQSGIFEDLTIKAIKNEISSEEYHDQILTKISVDKEKALEIISSVNEKIFKKIREIMQENNDFKKDDNIFSGDKIPLPPYIQKENLNEVPEKKIITEDYPKTETETLITKTEKEEPKATFIKEGSDTGIGGLNSVDFSIPKPIVDNIKNRTDGATSQANSSKPHDPYREII